MTPRSERPPAGTGGRQDQAAAKLLDEHSVAAGSDVVGARAMSRAARRAQERATRHDLRRLGCTCRAGEIALLPIDPAEVARRGALSGHFVSHRLGCPLGDWALGRNRAGFIPELHAVETECER